MPHFGLFDTWRSGFQFVADGAYIDLELALQHISMHWKGEAPEAEIQWALGFGFPVE